jgi:hypothetical protein
VLIDCKLLGDANYIKRTGTECLEIASDVLRFGRVSNALVGYNDSFHLLVICRSAKTVSQESFNSFVKIINGICAIWLAILPGKTSALEAVTGWEQYPTFRPPRMPKWMEE